MTDHAPQDPKSSPEWTLEALYAKDRRAEMAAFNQLSRIASVIVGKICRNKTDIEDVALKTMASVFNAVDARKLNDESHLIHLTAYIANKTACHWVRDRMTQKRGSGDELLSLEDGLMISAEASLAYGTLTDLDTLLSHLQPLERDIVTLIAIEGYTSAEVGKKVKLHDSVVRRKYGEALASLKKIVADPERGSSGSVGVLLAILLLSAAQEIARRHI